MLKGNKKYLNMFCFVLIEFIFSINTLAQNFKDPSIGISNRVYVQYTDSLVETFCYRGEKKIRTKDHLFYYWYAAQDIKHTRGAYEGKILHGTYTLFYYNKDLLVKGNFVYGLKHGIWRKWYQGGQIKSKETWRKGILVGKAYYYNGNGIIEKESNINQRTGNGYVKLYNEDGILNAKKIYKNNLLDENKTYQVNEKGKLIKIKPEKIKSNKIKSFPGKLFFWKKNSADEEKKVKQKKGDDKKEKDKKLKDKKQKQPKIKIQKYREVLPGGTGA